ncbi:dimethylaniline monooxygenase [N-oxide-forming] 2-like isoform X2 [Pantherophis guttatus]|uniref:Flavin-containing monooxygenase n=1 Tax=Pantherophis guttatus TaxID=94885 RepID=A0A6P9BD18_PANGU|nr:dimethylaniline monooxygenase [N-oxide-forming] 2-like isoform X2 [Pantherophis guttatus]
MAKRVAIIGAGASGLTAIKCCLDEGLQPTCFERNEDIGGLWRFQEHVTEGHSSIYKSLTTNSSKELMSFSDFPFPEEYSNYVHHSKMMEYFRMYAKQFDLIKYIHFKAQVCHLRKHTDFPITGQWEIVTEMNQRQESAVFDAVLLCTGLHAQPYFPLNSFLGVEKFKGEIIHSSAYKNPEKYQDQQILIIGMGNSGIEIAIDLSHITKQVFLSTRTGAWVINRVSDGGYPFDVVHFTHFKNLLFHKLPVALINQWGEKKLNMKFNHENYGVKPQHRFLSKSPIMGDDLPNAIIAGRVLMKPHVKKFTERGVIFEDGSTEENIDVVIFATGYKFSFPYTQDTILRTQTNQLSLYKYVFPPHLEKHTLAVIGFIKPIGATMPISELQVRWATRIFKGLSKLPSENDMMTDIVKKTKYNEKWYTASHINSLIVQYIDYMDELASILGVKPKVLSLLLTDPKLAWEVYFGPCSATQFRLTGPGKWEGARNTILTQRERIIKPTKTRPLQSSTNTKVTLVSSFFIKALICLGLLTIVLTYL